MVSSYARNAEEAANMDGINKLLSSFSADSDALLVILLVLLLYRQGAEKPIIFALLYLLL